MNETTDDTLSNPTKVNRLWKDLQHTEWFKIYSFSYAQNYNEQSCKTKEEGMKNGKV